MASLTSRLAAFGPTLGLTLGLVLLALPLRAEPLIPFKAHYQAEFETGMRLSGDAVRELEQLTDGRWRLSVEASTLMARIRETSDLELHQEGVRPLRYHYQRKVLGKKREATLTFDWDALSVLNEVKDTPWTLDIAPGIHDKLSYQLQLRRDLAAGQREDLNYTVADGGLLKTYRFELLGEETVESPAGRFTALKLRRVRKESSDRETLIWMAPALDYTIVRLTQVEGDDKRYHLLLKKLEVDTSPR